MAKEIQKDQERARGGGKGGGSEGGREGGREGGSGGSKGTGGGVDERPGSLVATMSDRERRRQGEVREWNPYTIIILRP